MQQRQEEFFAFFAVSRAYLWNVFFWRRELNSSFPPSLQVCCLGKRKMTITVPLLLWLLGNYLLSFLLFFFENIIFKNNYYSFPLDEKKLLIEWKHNVDIVSYFIILFSTHFSAQWLDLKIDYLLYCAKQSEKLLPYLWYMTYTRQSGLQMTSD